MLRATIADRSLVSLNHSEPVGSTPGSLVQASGLVVFRGERLVLDGVSFRVAAGDALVVVGRNGAGKSTLLRVLAGLLRLDGGTLDWALPEERRVAYLGHADAVKPGLTARENLRFAAAGQPPDAALAAFGLAGLADLPARMLSAGQRRRLALARLPLSGAVVWLLDEPTLGLDTASLALLAGALADHRRAGGAVIAATHQDLALPGASSLSLL